MLSLAFRSIRFRRANSSSLVFDELARRKLERLLTNDPAMGVIRHVDAGYSRADQVAHERGVRIPMTPVRRD